MSQPFATVEDIEILFRPLTAQEQAKATALLPLVSDELRLIARGVNKDLDKMRENDSVYASVLKIVTVDVCARVIRQNTEGDAMTQESQSALGYSWSGTYAVVGGGIANAILNNDLKKLGLLRQKVGGVLLWESCKVSV